jgi:acyl phosphate:glycerol-3-phosphate acyltransferase
MGYLLGSIPAAFLVVRWRSGVDIRKAGSGNVGALNSFLVTRSKLVGFSVLLFDALKGMLAVQTAAALSGGSFLPMGAAAIGAVLGHNFPVWLRGKGGRGLATAAGAAATFAPAVILVWGVFWGWGFALFREVNMANAAACLGTLCLLLAAPFAFVRSLVLWPVGPAEGALVVSLLFAVLLSRLAAPVLAYVRARRVR